MNKIKQLYQRISLREKLLLTAFIWVVVIISFLFALDATSKTWKNWKLWSNNLNEQKAWLSLAPTIEANLRESLTAFNPDRTFDSASLVGRIDALARQTGVNHDIANPRSQQGERFEFHTMRVTIRRTPMEKWIAFTNQLRAESPYINIESIRLNADSRSPDLLDGQFIIQSFELKDDSQ